jgi:Family of unknown function (DUF5871)
MSSPVLPANIDLSNLKYSQVKILSSGAKTVYINYGTSKLRIQTPVMYVPYGINEGGFEDKNAKVEVKTTDKKYDITLSFKGHEENEKISTFLKKVKELEQKIIDDAFQYREPWFKDSDLDRKMLEKFFSPVVKVDKDKNTGKVVGKYPPTIRFKLPYDNENDKFKFQSYNMEKEPIELLDILTKLKGGKAQLIVELSAIWFSGSKFGITFKVITGKFQRSISNDVSFIDDSDTENAVNQVEEEEDEEVVEITQKMDDTKVDNSGDEEYTEQEAAEQDTEQEVVSQQTTQEKKKGGRAAKK